MALADGTIRIDTRLNTKGFDTGVMKMVGSLKRFGKMAAATLASIGATAGFGAFLKDAVNAASEYENAMIGMESVVKGTGGSISEATRFLQEYTQDGLIPMANAATALKNLTARGYNMEQIEKTMTALKDASAFGRQGQLSMGEAVQSATEGLKNENSVLVDNAGVTKNVSVMWQDYAVSIGKTVYDLTAADKIIAETNGIMHESRFQMGDAAKVSETYSGKVARLGTAFNALKRAIGESVIPIMNILVPAITSAINWLTALFQRVATIMKTLFGTPIQDALAGTTDATNEATEAQEGLAGAVDKTKKAAEGSLAAFDEINVLNQDTGDGAGAGAGGGVEVEPIETPEPEGEDAALGKWKEIALKIKDFFAPISEAWGKVGEAFKRLGKAITDALEPLFGDGSAAGKFIESVRDGIVVAIELFAKAIDWLAGVIEENPEIIQVLTMALISFGIALALTTAPLLGIVAAIVILLAIIGFLATHADEVKEAWVKFVTWLKGGVESMKGFFADLVKKAKEGWQEILKKAKEAWENIKKNAKDNMIDPIKKSVKELKDDAIKKWDEIKGKAETAWNNIKTKVDEVIGSIKGFITNLKNDAETAWNNIKGFGETAWTGIKTAWENAKTWFDTNIITPIKTAFDTAWSTISGKVTGVWDAVKLAWQNAKTWFDTNIITPIETAFDTAWTNIETSVGTAFTGVKNKVKEAINGVIGFLNQMLSAITGGINSVIDLMNGLSFKPPKWVQDLFGVGDTIGFNLGHVGAPQIPYLASGAVIPPNAEFAAILGDQSAGRNLEAPESLIRKIVREETARQPGQEVTINFAGNMAALVRTMKPYIDKENKRTGTSLVTGRGRA